MVFLPKKWLLPCSFTINNQTCYICTSKLDSRATLNDVQLKALKTAHADLQLRLQKQTNKTLLYSTSSIAIYGDKNYKEPWCQFLWKCHLFFSRWSRVLSPFVPDLDSDTQNVIFINPKTTGILKLNFLSYEIFQVTVLLRKSEANRVDNETIRCELLEAIQFQQIAGTSLAIHGEKYFGNPMRNYC